MVKLYKMNLSISLFLFKYSRDVLVFNRMNSGQCVIEAYPR